ncbi:MAG TPA: hypothetical protein VMV59_04305 [Candidatus Dormibacteraeota bacterium]|nr:hypothetical protein [Candidatus Dormibacteraeota bacterium]
MLGLGGIVAGDDDARGRVDPFACVVDARDGADGANDGVGRDGHFADAFDDAFESETKIQAAAREQAGGVGMAVDGREITEMIALDEVEGIAPVEEIEFDGGAGGMIADAAFGGVAGEIGGESVGANTTVGILRL